MIRIPLNRQWQQSNSSDLFGTGIFSSKNICLDEAGYLKLAPRTVSIASEEDVAHLGLPLSIGRIDAGAFLAVTDDEPFEIDLSDTSISVSEDTDTGNPALSPDSSGRFWQNRWHATTDDGLVYKSGSDWTDTSISLTSGVAHPTEVFRNRNTLCIGNGNEVMQVDTSYSDADIDQLVLPADYEVIGLAYSGLQLGIVTRLSDDIEGQNQDAYFFTWDGSSAEAGPGVPIGSDAGVAIVPYKGSFVLLTRKGQLLLWNGGGFDELASFPIYFSKTTWGDFLNRVANGDILQVDGDQILANVSFDLDQFGKRQEAYASFSHSGVWCLDLKAGGLYQRYSPSVSTMNQVRVNDSGIDTSTNVFTAFSGTLPETGAVMRYVFANAGDEIGGLTKREDYYLIKLTSSTFKLATTRANALAGTAIDITDVGGTVHYFAAIDVLDYGAIYTKNTGGVALMGEQEAIYDHVVFGAEIFDYDSTSSYNHLQLSVPDLENRGYVLTPWIVSSGTEDQAQGARVHFRPLRDDDQIIVKAKTRRIAGLPVHTVQKSQTCSWQSSTAFTTTADLSDAKAAFDAGVEIECEIIAGAGAGMLAKVSALTEASGTYTVTLAEEIIGAASGRYCQAQLDNFTHLKTLTASSLENDECHASVPLGAPASEVMWKVEMRGVGTTIRSLDVQTVLRKP